MTNAMTKQRVSILPILSINFIGTLGFSIVLPFLVFLVTKWGGNAVIYGIMGATYSFFQLIGAPILGRWSDTYGRRKILLVSQTGTLVSWLIFLTAFFVSSDVLLRVDSSLLGTFSLSAPLVLLFVARAADGLTGGNVSVANAYLADITAEDKRSINFGKMAASGNLGFIIGPALAGILSATIYGELLPVIAATLISAVATVLIIFRLPESKPCLLKSQPESNEVRKVFGQEQKECYELKGAKQASLAEILSKPGMTPLLSMYMLVMLAFNFFYVTFPVHAVRSLQWSITDTGVFFAVMSVLMVLTQGPGLKLVSRVWPDTRLVSIGGFILAGSFLLFLSYDKTVIFIGAAVLAVGNGLMWSSLVAVLSRVAGDEIQGAAQGIAGSGGALASIVGLIAGGVLYDILGAKLFVLSALIIFVTFLISLRACSRKFVPVKQTATR